MSRLLKGAQLDIAEQTIEDALRDFLEAPLFYSGKTGADARETTVELLQGFIYYHGHNTLCPAERCLYDQYFQQKMPNQRGYHQIFGPAKIPGLLQEFFIFFSYEITPVASQKFVQSTCQTLEELSLWLIKNDYIDAEEGEEAAYRSAQAARNLPRAMRALKRMHNEAVLELDAEAIWCSEGECEKYKIVRLAQGLFWLENEDGERAGPIKISEKVKRDLETGWEIRCSLVKLHNQWKITGLAGIYPYPRQVSISNAAD